MKCDVDLVGVIKWNNIDGLNSPHREWGREMKKYKSQVMCHQIVGRFGPAGSPITLGALLYGVLLPSGGDRADLAHINS